MTELQKSNMRKHIAFLRDNANLIRKRFDMENWVFLELILRFLVSGVTGNIVFLGCGLASTTAQKPRRRAWRQFFIIKFLKNGSLSQSTLTPS